MNNIIYQYRQYCLYNAVEMKEVGQIVDDEQFTKLLDENGFLLYARKHRTSTENWNESIRVSIKPI